VQSSSLPFLPSPEALRAAAGVGSSPQSFDYGTQFLGGGEDGSTVVSRGVAPHFDDAVERLDGLLDAVSDEEAPTFRRIEDYAQLTLSEAEAQHAIALEQLKAEIDADGKRTLAEARSLQALESLRDVIQRAFGPKGPEARGGQRIRYGDELLNIGGRNFRVNLDTGQLAEVGQTLPGQSPSSPVINVNVEGSVIAESDLRGVVVDAVNEGQRRGELLSSA